MSHTLRKTERISKRKIIEKLFAGGAHSFSVFPLRVVFLPVEGLDAQAAILVSVPKRRFKRAVKRNRVKRLVREAYRTQKHELLEALAAANLQMAIAFIYLSDELADSALIEERVRMALRRINENLPGNKREEKEE